MLARCRRPRAAPGGTRLGRSGVAAKPGVVRTGSLRTQSARHRVDLGTICRRSCANSGHYKPLCACVDRTFVKSVAPACREFFLRVAAILSLPTEDVYRCPAGEKLTYHMTTEQDGKMMRRYWTNACLNCSLKSKCTTGNERRIPRWEHEHVLEAVQQRLDANPQAMRQRRETVEHPFATLKMRMGATHFLMKRLPKVATEMALHVLAYNLTRVMSIIGVKRLLAVMRAYLGRCSTQGPAFA
jgi:macrodomain Ter protein organizer (MatP/YcbG family)